MKTALHFLELLKKVAKKESQLPAHPTPIKTQIFLMFCNRIIIDTESILLLSEAGYYGSAFSLCAIDARNIMMYASLISEETRMQKFWDEDGGSYQNDKDFKKQFTEGESARIAQTFFGNDSFNKNEMDKLLHGSCYAIRKGYSKREVNEQGLRYPVITLGSFFEKEKNEAALYLAKATMADFLGSFFTAYKKDNRSDLQEEISEYYMLAKKIQNENIGENAS